VASYLGSLAQATAVAAATITGPSRARTGQTGCIADAFESKRLFAGSRTSGTLIVSISLLGHSS